MTNRIEQIIDRAIGDAADELHISQIPVVRKDILTALDAAGLAVLPKEATDDMRGHGCSEPAISYRRMAAAFDSNTWEPADEHKAKTVAARIGGCYGLAIADAMREAKKNE